MEPDIPKLEKASHQPSPMYKNEMDQMSSVAVMNRNSTAPGSLYMANDITAEAVISELNLFRPTTTSLPLWNGITSTASQGMNYSIISNPSTTNSMSTASSSHQTENSNQANGCIAVSSAGSSFDVFSNGTSREVEPPTSLPLSPRVSFSESATQSPHDSPNSSDQEDSEQPFPKRKKRTPVPDDRKDAKYWDRRKKNNDAAKRSRDMRRKKIEDELKNAREAIQENQKLKQEIDVLKAEINSLRRLLKDANTTLSLWIRARQAAEPNVQLPPMLRGSNVSFVNFPVTTAS